MRATWMLRKAFVVLIGTLAAAGVFLAGARAGAMLNGRANSLAVAKMPLPVVPVDTVSAAPALPEPAAALATDDDAPLEGDDDPATETDDAR